MKAKSIIVILVTLIIGFILGMLTSAQIRYNKLKPVRVFFSEERFREGFYRTIEPNEQQKTKIDLVLNKYAKINSELQSNFMKELDSNMKEFRKELDMNLSKEQLARLKEMDERRQEMIRHNRNNFQNDSLNMRPDRRHFPGGRPGPDFRPPFRPDSGGPGLPDHK
jgi:AraC-like DNA-binding protein